MSRGPRPGAVTDLVIRGLAGGGDGIARLDGLAVFVPFTAPGDRVRARITQVRSRFARAELLEVVVPGRGRREPGCPHFARCGGCAWLHLSERVQSRARLEGVRDALKRIGAFDDVPLRSLASPLSRGYRLRARIAVADGKVGFRAAASREVIDIAECAILDPGLQDALSALRADPPEPGEYEIRAFDPSEVLRVGDDDYRVTHGAFFQANASLLEAWLEAVVAACGSGRKLVELFAGIGFYTRALEEHFSEVVAVERDPRAASNARHNTRRATIIEASAEAWAPRALRKHDPDVICLNPPRTGCDPVVIDAIRETSAARVVYISCDASTLARDLKRLGDGFEIVDALVIDALPQTPHVEVVVQLTARGTRR